MKKLLSIMGAALLMASCTEDYKDWANPFSNGPEDPVTVSLSAAPAAPIDFATAGSQVQAFVPTLTAPEGTTATYNIFPYQDDILGSDVEEYLTADENGNVNAHIKVSAFRPYVGIGFGRVVPAKSRVAFNCDLGVQFWGKPTVTCQDQELKDEDLKGDDGGIVRYITKMSVWPVLNLRATFRLF